MKFCKTGDVTGLADVRTASTSIQTTQSAYSAKLHVQTASEGPETGPALRVSPHSPSTATLANAVAGSSTKPTPRIASRAKPLVLSALEELPTVLVPPAEGRSHRTAPLANVQVDNSIKLPVQVANLVKRPA
jgi:hypothetical protein